MKRSAHLIRKAGNGEKDFRNRGKGGSGQDEHNVAEWILFNSVDSVYSVISASSVVKNNFAA
jgi:hypothetical protein